MSVCVCVCGGGGVLGKRTTERNYMFVNEGCNLSPKKIRTFSFFILVFLFYLCSLNGNEFSEIVPSHISKTLHTTCARVFHFGLLLPTHVKQFFSSFFLSPPFIFQKKLIGLFFLLVLTTAALVDCTHNHSINYTQLYILIKIISRPLFVSVSTVYRSNRSSLWWTLKNNIYLSWYTKICCTYCPWWSVFIHS